jgi:RNA 2',3'-cyclic 3'-phosphodiesterase
MPDHQAPTKPHPAHRPAHVLFFAAVPPDTIKDQIADAWRSTGTGERFRRDTLHMTIQVIAGLNEPDPVLVDRARLAAAAPRTGPFELCFDRLLTFGGRPDNRALVLATDGRRDDANDLAVELHQALKAVGLAPPRWQKVVPHLTLAYGPGFADTRHLAQPIRWTIRDITLVDSLQGQGRHVSLGNWPLLEGRQHPSFDF